MKVVDELPPNYDEICELLGTPPASAVFAWGETIYNPSGRAIPPDLQAHEETHARQQQEVGGPEAWWRRYLDDPVFRLGQEVEAYRVQIRWFQDRGTRLRAWRAAAEQLAGEMYGWIVTPEQARRLLRSPA